ncbi:hypothetical protein GCM10007304_22810 [Rhodococcoides trifolii]|uniref:Ribosomal protein L7/L12 C-terminal domain-containing protein n=1 Tax=Rhodococcoides trifolii TaxID=908250 RepID=A0A917FV54_9NOCA|nr:hypothetical protein [Rhodococcus trifolii]GGG08159.1 hypothetical protein GCM10007304_22810 [Rhodococcus trifolii]
MARWMEDERLQRWGRTLFLLYLLGVAGPTAVDSLTTARDWAHLAVWLVAVIGFAGAAYGSWKRYRHPERITAPVPPNEVDAADVTSVIDVSGSRIGAIKSLRTLYPGLGLRDAKDLVDRHSVT